MVWSGRVGGGGGAVGGGRVRRGMDVAAIDGGGAGAARGRT